MDLGTWVAFALLETFLCLVPGPAVLFVVGSTLGRGPASGFSAAAGIVTGNLAYFLLSATGIGALLVASYEAFSVVRWVGAAYLIYLGLRALFAPGEFGTVRPVRVGRSLIGGTMTQLANPKALIFFTALLPQFIDPHRSLVVQLAILAVTSQAIESLVMTGYVTLAHGVARGIGRDRFAAVFERVAGLFLIGAALRLAFAARQAR